ncbi:MAG: hypothetical protein JF612_08950, partial [Planctomycetia bacterium]|nr:hypothetical protein [Planctomycetia bacterium]
MSAVIRIRLGLLLAAGVLFAGCGRGTPSSLGATKSQAPRRIQLPANIRPLVPDRAESQTYSETGSIPVQYQQPQSSADSRAPSNVVLSAGPQTTGVEPVREPSSPPALAANEAPAAPPNRSQF